MSFLNENENELVMESMVSQEVETKAKKVSKSLTMNEKRSLYNILSFLVIANRDGILDDAKTQELMEHLPIFKTISEKKEFLSQEMFDLNMIEKDILKPMVAEHNAKKKQEKKEEKKKGKKEKEAGEASKEPKEVKKKEPKEVKKRAPKKEKVIEEVVEKVVEEDHEVVKEVVKKETKKRAPKKEKVVEAESEVPEKDQKKRGRKAKQQIVECNTEVNVNAGNSQEDQLADLVNQLTGTVACVQPVLELKHPDQDQDPEEIDLADLDEVLSNLEGGEVQEKEKEKLDRVMTPRLPEVEVEKKGKGKESKKKVTKPSKK